MRILSVSIKFYEQKEGVVVYSYGLFLKIRIISTKPTIRAMNSPVIAGMKYWSAIDLR
jgi:hypothetical protein